MVGLVGFWRECHLLIQASESDNISSLTWLDKDPKQWKLSFYLIRSGEAELTVAITIHTCWRYFSQVFWQILQSSNCGTRLSNPSLPIGDCSTPTSSDADSSLGARSEMLSVDWVSHNDTAIHFRSGHKLQANKKNAFIYSGTKLRFLVKIGC